MIGGVWQDLSPLPPRKAIPGWRLAAMGNVLTREVALGAGEGAGDS